MFPKPVFRFDFLTILDLSCFSSSTRNAFQNCCLHVLPCLDSGCFREACYGDVSFKSAMMLLVSAATVFNLSWILIISTAKFLCRHQSANCPYPMSAGRVERLVLQREVSFIVLRLELCCVASRLA